MIIIGTLRSFGIIYAELLETYNVGVEYTAIIFSLVIFLVAVGGMSHKKLDIYLNNTLYCRVRGFIDIDMGTNRVLFFVDLFFYSYVIPMRQRLFQIPIPLRNM
jgi:hypothetical protein